MRLSVALASVCLSSCYLPPASKGSGSGGGLILGETSGGSSGGGSSGATCPEFFAGDCSGPDVCSTQLDYPCVTVPGQGSACLGVAGAVCQSDCDCVTGRCASPVHVDCFPPHGCPDTGPTCAQSSLGGPCAVNSDCEDGNSCQQPDGGAAPHETGSCCVPEGTECNSGNPQCCAGLFCHSGLCLAVGCVIEGLEYQAGEANRANSACQYCDPSTSTTAWTTEASGACGTSNAAVCTSCEGGCPGTGRCDGGCAGGQLCCPSSGGATDALRYFCTPPTDVGVCPMACLP